MVFLLLFIMKFSKKLAYERFVYDSDSKYNFTDHGYIYLPRSFEPYMAYPAQVEDMTVGNWDYWFQYYI